jgi:hypothetical protein
MTLERKIKLSKCAKFLPLLAVRYHLETKLKLVATTEKELKSPMDS